MDDLARTLARHRARPVRPAAPRARAARRPRGLPMIRAAHRQPGFLAALLHRLSGLVLAVFLPAHFMALGLRVLAIEFLPWRDRTAATVSACLGAALMVGLLFLLNAA